MKEYEVIVDEIFIYSMKSIKEYYNNDYKSDYYYKIEKYVLDKINFLSENPYFYNYDIEYGEEIRKIVLVDFEYNIFYFIYESKKQVYVLDIRHFKKNKQKINKVNVK